MIRPLATLLIGALSFAVSPADSHDVRHLRGERMRFHAAGARPGTKVVMLPRLEAAGPDPDSTASEDQGCPAGDRAMMAAAPVVAWLLSGLSDSRD
jgi:hypothetical protein